MEKPKDKKLYECGRCGRTSTTIELDKDCPFCDKPSTHIHCWDDQVRLNADHSDCESCCGCKMSFQLTDGKRLVPTKSVPLNEDNMEWNTGKNEKECDHNFEFVKEFPTVIEKIYVTKMLVICKKCGECRLKEIK